MPNVARLGDPLDHGGVIVTASPNVTANGIAVARKGDMAACLVHGLVEIIEGSGTVSVNGRPRARVGDRCSCGAVIITGSGNVSAGG